MTRDPYRDATWSPSPPPAFVELDALVLAQKDAIAAIRASTGGERCAWCGEHAIDEIEVDIARGRDPHAYSEMHQCSACERVQP